MSMKYGKMNNGVISMYKGEAIKHEGRVYVNSREDTLQKLGYMPVELEEAPCEERYGYYAENVFKEEDGKIKGRWVWREISDGIYEDLSTEAEVTEVSQ